MRQLMFSLYTSKSLDDRLIQAVRDGQISTFCLFGDSSATPAQVRAMTDSLREAALSGGHLAPLIGTDQEGGQLIAIGGGATELPGNMALGATRDPALAEKAGYVLARELSAMGMTLDFAPVLDVLVNPENPSVGVRSFGDDPQLAGELGAGLIRGMQSVGGIACAKHFPGSGDLTTDTHHAAGIVPHSLDRLNQLELVPFRAAITAKVGAIMSAHVIFSALDTDNPATLSSKVMNGFLRGELGYDGLIITDAMDMHAVSMRGNVECVVQALQAGVDLALIGHLPDPFGIMDRVNELGLTNPAALSRIEHAQRSAPQTLLPLEVVGCAEHQQIAQEIADRSITVVRNGGQFPLRPSDSGRIAVLAYEFDLLTPADSTNQIDPDTLYNALVRRHGDIHQVACSGTGDSFMVDWAGVDAAQTVIIPTDTVHRRPWQAALVRAILARGKRPIVVAVRSPHDITAFAEVDCYLCAYSPRPVSMEAVARVLFGEIEATGVLPCDVPLG